MKYLFLTLLIFCTARLSAQNAFFDAQALAAITPMQLTAMEEIITNSQVAKNFSQEEISALSAIIIICNDQCRFSVKIDPSLLNKSFVEKILVKIKKYQGTLREKQLNPSSSSFAGALSVAGFIGSATGVTNSSNNGNQTGFTSLVDATSTYIATSFKEDMVYLYFNNVRKKLEVYPELKYLLPESYQAILKLDPFNFRDLGTEWKVAFAKDMQQLPKGSVDYILNNKQSAWATQVQSSTFFKYYQLYVNSSEALKTGLSPLEVLYALDDQYYNKEQVSTPISLLHFTNLLQANLQDSLEKSEAVKKNNWVSFNQLKALNTAAEQQLFCALLYHQDHDFFEDDALGKSLGKMLKDGSDKAPFINALGKLLIVLSQVGQPVEAESLKGSDVVKKTKFVQFVKNFNALLTSTSTLLHTVKINDSSLNSQLAEFDKFAGTAVTVSGLYEDIILKNYPGLMEKTSHILKDFGGNAALYKVLSSVQGSYVAYEALRNEIQQANLQQLRLGILLDEVLANNLALGSLDLIKFESDFRLMCREQNLQDQAKVEAWIKQAQALITQLNSGIADSEKRFLAWNLKFSGLLESYGKAIAAIAAADDNQDLKNVIKTYIATPSTFAVYRNTTSSLSIASEVGLSFSMEGNKNWDAFKPNIGLTVPLGFQYAWGNRSTTRKSVEYLDGENKRNYLSGTSNGFFVQVFDLAAVVNYRLSADSAAALPNNIKLKQIFSPGLAYHFGFRDLPFALSLGLQYTPALRKIGADLQANSIRVLLRFSWQKPLLFLYHRKRY